MSRASAPDVAAIASALANPARADMVLALMDGRAWTQGELARAARVTASTASAHVDRLLTAGVVAELRSGRHRYVRLSGPEVADLIEALGALSDIRPADRSFGAQRADSAMREGRSCYAHLAGRLGVALCAGARSAGYVDGQWALTTSGRDWLHELGVELPDASRSALVRPCLDWTERVEHLAGAAADALLTRSLSAGWLARPVQGERAIALTAAGEQVLGEVLNRTAATRLASW